eukprot:c25712_g1_i2 orf=282-1604(+)
MEEENGAAALETVKLFVGQIPRQMTEEELLPVFQEAGDVREISIIRDKATKMSRGCCFLIYATKEEADNAIDMFHNKRKLPPLNTPLQVKYADGELERLEHKLFVGMLPKSASAEDITKIFSPYGEIKELTVIKGSQASKGCAFLKYGTRYQAMLAIKALNGTFKMEGSTSALVVKWADTEKEKQARKTQKAQAAPVVTSVTVPVHQPSIYGTVPSGYAPSLNGYGYQAQSAFGMTQYAGLPLSSHPGISGGLLNAGGTVSTMQATGYDLGTGGGPILAASYGATQPAGYLSSLYQPLSGAQYPGVYQSNLLGQAAVTSMYQAQAPTAVGLNASMGVTPPVKTTPGPQVEGPPGANLFIYHLPAEFGDLELSSAFQPFGKVISAKVFVDKVTGLSKCFGFVSYSSPDAAAAAINTMNGSQLGGKRLKVQLKRDSRQSKPY